MPAVLRRRDKILAPVHPNFGMQVELRRRLDRVIDEMHRSVTWHALAAYRNNPPEMAQDASPAAELDRVMRSLAWRWRKRFNELSVFLASWFAKSIMQRSDAALRASLKKAGWTVKFQMSPEMNDVLRATIAENVALIKSIPEQYLVQVQGAVMRSIIRGRDLGPLAKELEEHYGVTKRRAALIARDQNNKATSAMSHARQAALGIKTDIWMHSHAGREPRPSHVAMNGKPYDIKKGMWDDHEKEWVFPGQLINCFPGSASVQFADSVEIAYRHWYSGNLTKLVTSSGKVMSATPNHPILTPDGWVAVGSLYEGDYVIEVADEGLKSIMSECHVDHAIPTFAQIFDTLMETGDLRSEISMSGQFHGDGGTHGYVDIVLAARALRFGIKVRERFDHLDFTVPNLSHFGVSFVEPFLRSSFRSTASFVGCLGESLSSQRSFVGHPDVVGFAAPSDYTARRNYPGGNGMTRESVLLGQSQHADPSFVLPTQATRIIRVDEKSFDGHVFNLQTRDGWYVTEGIITHNCRCTSRPVLTGLGV